ncbi:MAG: NAD(P)/FAD-dependent oxidoreductase [Pseudomonadota bacterium]
MPSKDAIKTDLLIVGAGFSGIAVALEAMRQGMTNIIILEKADDIGGTWRENTYPGVACDVPSHLYCLANHPNPNWSDFYASGHEIQNYLKVVAQSEGIYAITRFGREVTDARWMDAERAWTVKTDTGEVYRSNALIAAPGPLHVPKRPDIPGLDAFAGKVMHSAQWDHSFDLTDTDVAVIGTGASAIQFVPNIAPLARHLTVFQRTAPWVVPRLFGKTSRLSRWLFKKAPVAQSALRAAVMSYQELLHRIFRGQKTIGRWAQNVSLWHMRHWIKDAALREKLTPSFRIGCKRILFSREWYPALARDNVKVQTDAIVRITKGGVKTADGTTTRADVILLGTGFQVTEAPLNLPFRGVDGLRLSEAWSDVMTAYLGSSIPGFPNFFLMLGPNSGLGHNSVVLIAEAQAEHAIRMILDSRKQGLDAITPKASVHKVFQKTLQSRLAKTIWQTGGCASWYQDTNGQNTTIWPGTVKEFQTTARAASLDDFERA